MPREALLLSWDEDILITDYQMTRVNLDLGKRLVSNRRMFNSERAGVVMVKNQNVTPINTAVHYYVSSRERINGIPAAVMITRPVFKERLVNFFLKEAISSSPTCVFKDKSKAKNDARHTGDR